MKKCVDSRYFVEAAAKVLEVLESFNDYEEQLSVSKVSRRVHIPYSSAFRLMYTLEARGYITRGTGGKKYTLVPPRPRYRIGYAALDNRTIFSESISGSLILAARNAGIDLLTKDNELAPRKALANVDLLLEEKVRLVVVDQPDEEVALSISEKCQKAGVPLLAINYPHPGAYYFGGNNYLAGQLAGKFLRKHVMSHWHGHVDSMFLLPVKGHSFSQEAHKEGIREVFCKEERLLPQEEIFEAPPGFSEQDGYRETKAFLREAGRKPRHLIIAAMSDFLGMGAAKAVHQMGLSESAVIVGAGAARDTRSLIMRGGPFRASVAYFPESYGDRIVNLSLKILGKEEAPLTSFTNHALLAHENLREYYP